jgi:excisionase family DNA binding protein
MVRKGSPVRVRHWAPSFCLQSRRIARRKAEKLRALALLGGVLGACSCGWPMRRWPRAGVAPTEPRRLTAPRVGVWRETSEDSAMAFDPWPPPTRHRRLPHGPPLAKARPPARRQASALRSWWEVELMSGAHPAEERGERRLTLTVRQVAAQCQVSPKTVYRAILRGDLRAAPLGRAGAYRIRPEWVEAWIDGQSLEVDRDAHAPEALLPSQSDLNQPRRMRRARGRPGRLKVPKRAAA